jgi:branched-chain amino acid transport system substrate-binding protein
MLNHVARLLLAISVVMPFTGSNARAEEDFRIGLPIELSGRFVAFGAQVKKGAETAVEVWRSVRGEKVAGRTITLIIHDVQSNTVQTVSAMNELINSDRAHVLVGPGASNIGAAAIPPWKKSENRPIWLVPGVSTTVAEKEVGKDPYYFHNFPWAYHYHATNAEALKQTIGSNKKVAIVYSDGAYGRAHVDHARQYLKAAGFDIVGEELIREGANDFTPALLRVRAKRPEVLYALVQTDDAVLLTKQVYSTNLNVPYLVGTFQAVTPEWRAAVGDLQNCWTGVTTYLPGMVYAADAREPKLFPAAKEWESKWRAKYNKEPEYMEVGAYISTMEVLLAAEKSNSTDRDKLAAVLARDSYATMLGNSRFEPSEVALHQAFGTMVAFQQQKVGSEYKSVVFYPPAVAEGKPQPCPAR